MKKFVFIIIGAFFLSCSKNNSATNGVHNKYSLLSLPISNECDNGLESNDSWFITENGINYRIVGEIPSPNKNTYLLCRIDGGDIGIPVICIYDSAETFVQSYDLLLNGCTADEDAIMKNQYVINKQLEILSTEIYSYGSWNSTFVADSSLVRVRHSVINSKGVFEIESETSNIIY